MKVQTSVPVLLLAALTVACDQPGPDASSTTTDYSVDDGEDGLGEWEDTDFLGSGGGDPVLDFEGEQAEAEEPVEETDGELEDEDDLEEANHTCIDEVDGERDGPCAGLTVFDDAADADALRVCAALERIDALDVLRVSCVVRTGGTAEDTYDFTQAELAERIEALADATEDAVENYVRDGWDHCSDDVHNNSREPEEGVACLDYHGVVENAENLLESLEIVGIETLVGESGGDMWACPYQWTPTSDELCDNMDLAGDIHEALSEE